MTVHPRLMDEVEDIWRRRYGSGDYLVERLADSLYELANGTLTVNTISPPAPAPPVIINNVESIATERLMIELLKRGYAVIKLPEDVSMPRTLGGAG